MPATSPLPPPDRLRLTKLLGLLGSDYAGERDAAGLAAHRLVRERGLSWQDVIDPPDGPAPRPNVNGRPEPKPKPEPWPWQRQWHATVEACLRQSNQLTQWERTFLQGLPNFDDLSPKQQAVLARISARVLRRAAP